MIKFDSIQNLKNHTHKMNVNVINDGYASKNKNKKIKREFNTRQSEKKNYIHISTKNKNIYYWTLTLNLQENKIYL